MWVRREDAGPHLHRGYLHAVGAGAACSDSASNDLDGLAGRGSGRVVPTTGEREAHRSGRDQDGDREQGASDRRAREAAR